MTDKEQIMIDGVNISECKHFCLEAQIPEIPFAGYSNICCEENTVKECKDNPNCYFKQLARKTQELEVICKAFDIEYAYDDNGKIYGRSNKLRSLEQECEELKKELELNTQNAVTLDMAKRLYNYSKALDEIEEVINNILNSCLGRNTVGCTPVHNVCEELIKILDIINKAKEDNR